MVFEKIKKNMPAGIMTVGFIISGLLLMLPHLFFTDDFGYESFILNEFIHETALVVLVECLASAAAFKILLKKEKFSDRGFPQK